MRMTRSDDACESSPGDSVGIVGVGLVGSAVAERLLEKGIPVVGYDIDSARCRRLEGNGGRVAESPAAVGEQTDRVFLSLLTSAVVRQVVEGPDGLLWARHPPRYILDTTTGDPPAAARLAARLWRRGIEYLDATISGSSAQVRRGEATFMVGGTEAGFAANRALLSSLSRRVFHLGPAGSASKAKLASNLVLGLHRAVLAEGLVYAEQLGLDVEVFLEVLRNSPAYSRAVDSKGGKMLAGDFVPEARLSQHLKDVDLILAQAAATGQPLPLSQAHRDLLAAAVAAGDGDLDNAAVIRQIRRLKQSRAACPPENEEKDEP